MRRRGDSHFYFGGKMKRLVLVLILVLSSNYAFAATPNYKQTIDLTGKWFAGGEIQLGGLSDFGLGVVGGYQYYFPKEYQLNKFRHGIRAIGGLSYGIASYSTLFENYTWSSLSIQVGADYTIDFMPTSNFDWGFFAGLGLGYHNLFYDKSIYIYNHAFLFDAHVGASLTMYQHHRIDAQLGWGLGIFTIRYTYLF